MVAGLSIRELEEVGITDVLVICELAFKMLDATSFFPEYKSFKNKLTTIHHHELLKACQKTKGFCMSTALMIDA